MNELSPVLLLVKYFFTRAFKKSVVLACLKMFVHQYTNVKITP